MLTSFCLNTPICRAAEEEYRKSPVITTFKTMPPHPVIDSHIHLYPLSELSSLAWLPRDDPIKHPLGSQHSVNEYVQAVNAAEKSLEALKGFVFIETDRVSSPTSWEEPLNEVSWLTRIATGQPLAGEGHTEEQKKLCLGIVPWAPIPEGPEALEKYVSMVKERTGDEVFKKVKGFRYLVQDQPRGTMVGEKFVEGVKWLGRHKFAFDLGVDARSGGLWQLEEASTMISRCMQVPEHERTVFVISEPFTHPNIAEFTNER